MRVIMKHYILKFILLITPLIILSQGCATLFQREKLIREEIVRNNKIYLDSLTYGMTLRSVGDVISGKLSKDAREENPKFATEFKGKGQFEYFVQFYVCKDTVYSEELIFRDDRFFPLIFKDKMLVGIDWDDYENLIGAAFVTNSSRKAAVGTAKDTGAVEEDSLLLGIGTGFLINNKGYIVTNRHVVEDVDSVSVYSPVLNKKFLVSGFVKDIAHDLAILKIVDSTFTDSTFRKINYRIALQDEIKMGQQVFTLGFPLTTFLGTTSRLSDGMISSKVGVDDNPGMYQVSIPLQPGNSGGPMFNMRGNLAGIVVSKLDAPSILFETGILSQNINFAVKADYLKALLDSVGIPQPQSVIDPAEDLKMESLVEQLNDFIVMIVCEDKEFLRSLKPFIKKK